MWPLYSLCYEETSALSPETRPKQLSEDLLKYLEEAVQPVS